MNYNIGDIDANMRIEIGIGEKNAVFYDVRHKPFELYGFYDPLARSEFKRLPDEIVNSVSENVSRLYKNTAGGRVRFSTDSKYVAIKAVMPLVCKAPHMPLSASAGFDLYIDDPLTRESRFWRCFNPPMDMVDGYESKVVFEEVKMRYFTICFPLYSNVSELYIGVDSDASIGKGMPYKNMPPIVYYGSSITQGASACHSGNAYQNIISRHINVDFINLGFSGSAHGEEALAKYMATLNMSMFVCDYDHNSPNPQALEQTHFKFYEIIRESNPEVPYIMLTRPDFPPAIDRHAYESNVLRRAVIMEGYNKALRLGDNNVYFIDGSGIFKGRFEELCTIDGVHPNDLGFALMAEAIENKIKSILYT